MTNPNPPCWLVMDADVNWGPAFSRSLADGTRSLLLEGKDAVVLDDLASKLDGAHRVLSCHRKDPFAKPSLLDHLYSGPPLSGFLSSTAFARSEKDVDPGRSLAWIEEHIIEPNLALRQFLGQAPAHPPRRLLVCNDPIAHIADPLRPLLSAKAALEESLGAALSSELKDQGVTVTRFSSSLNADEIGEERAEIIASEAIRSLIAGQARTKTSFGTRWKNTLRARASLKKRRRLGRKEMSP